MMETITSFARNGRPTIPNTRDRLPDTDKQRTVMRVGASTELAEDPQPRIDEFAVAFEGQVEIEP